VCMDKELQQKTVFCSHSGLYEFSYAAWPCNTPATFQRLMKMVLTGLARDKCFVYLDDILVVGKTFAEHISNLEEVLIWLKNAGLCL